MREGEGGMKIDRGEREIEGGRDEREEREE